MASNETVARPYAEAIFDYAREQKSLDKWSDFLNDLATVIKDEQINAVIHSARVDGADVGALVCDVMGHKEGDPFANLIMTMAENERLDIIDDVLTQFETLKTEEEGAVDAVIESAQDVTDEQLKKITKGLEKRLGKKVHITTEVNPDLIGGAIIRAGDLVIDGSVSGKIQRMSSAVTH